MKIGYPCINWTIGCKGDRTFRLKSYSESRLRETVKNNLDCLETMLAFNIEQGLLFFRITSDLVPFASHPVCELDWAGAFREQFRAIGATIRRHAIRISMHPGQYTVLNSPKERVVENAIAELEYHGTVLDAMELDRSAKIQVHVGGVYGDKAASMERFIARYEALDPQIRDRLVIENDDRSYTLADCLAIHDGSCVPVLFDIFHHAVNPSDRSRALTLNEGIALAAATWTDDDGPLMVDYSSQEPDGRRGHHAEHLDERHFSRFLDTTRPHDFDLMLEIKSKEEAALRAVTLAQNDERVTPYTHKDWYEKQGTGG